MLPDGTYIDSAITFKYLGDIISYNLRDDDAIRARIKKAQQAMGRCRPLFGDDRVELYSKYIFFQQLVINALLWGCESWSLTEYWLDRLDSFLHRSIRSVLRINLQNIRDDRITNAYVRRIFYNIPDIRRLIAARTLKFIGKLGRELCNGNPTIPAKLLGSWVNNKRLPGGQCITNKKTIIKHLRLLYGDNIEDVVGNPIVTVMDRCGSFKFWLRDACDKPYWEKLIESKLVHPDRDIPLPNRDNNTFNPASSQPPTPPRRRNRSAGPPPSPPRHHESNSQLTHESCLAILGLNWGATEREIRRAYFEKAKELHPDRSSLPREEATARFQALNSAQAQLRGIDRDEPEDEEA